MERYLLKRSMLSFVIHQILNVQSGQVNMIYIIAAATILNSLAIVLLWWALKSVRAAHVLQAQCTSDDVSNLRSALKSATTSNVVKADQVLEWRARLAEYKEGSPKHTAYKNRLAQVELGELKVE